MRGIAFSYCGSRFKNEDAVVVHSSHADILLHGQKSVQKKFESPLPVFAAVIDGMGGHPGGDIAAEIIGKTLQQQFHKFMTANQHEQLYQNTFFHHTAELLQQRLKEKTNTEQSLYYMGAVAVLVLAYPDHITIAHCGDCRVYRKTAAGNWELLTRDHNIENESPGSILPRSRARQLSRAIMGNPPDFQNSGSGLFDVLTIKNEPGQRVILSSDGVHEYLPRLFPDVQDAGKLVNSISADIESISAPDNYSGVILDF